MLNLSNKITKGGDRRLLTIDTMGPIDLRHENELENQEMFDIR